MERLRTVLGMYSVMVAAMGRQIIACDPMAKNLALIHQSLKLTDRLHLATLINNPLRSDST